MPRRSAISSAVSSLSRVWGSRAAMRRIVLATHAEVSETLAVGKYSIGGAESLRREEKRCATSLTAGRRRCPRPLGTSQDDLARLCRGPELSPHWERARWEEQGRWPVEPWRTALRTPSSARWHRCRRRGGVACGIHCGDEVDPANSYRYYAADQIPVAKVIRRTRGRLLVPGSRPARKAPPGRGTNRPAPTTCRSEGNVSKRPPAQPSRSGGRRAGIG